MTDRFRGAMSFFLLAVCTAMLTVSTIMLAYTFSAQRDSRAQSHGVMQELLERSRRRDGVTDTTLPKPIVWPKR